MTVVEGRKVDELWVDQDKETLIFCVETRNIVEF